MKEEQQVITVRTIRDSESDGRFYKAGEEYTVTDTGTDYKMFDSVGDHGCRYYIPYENCVIVPPPSQDRSVSQPGKEEWVIMHEIYNRHVSGEGDWESAMTEYANLKVKKAHGEEWQSLYLEEHLTRLTREQELAALKSRPSEGWSDEDMRQGWIQISKIISNGETTGFDEWLSGFKHIRNMNKSQPPPQRFA